MWDVMTIALGGILAVALGSPVTLAVFHLADRRTRTARPALPNPHAPAASDPDSAAEVEPGDEPIQEAGRVLRGGLWIGILERLAIYSALLLGAVEVIAMVLAVKGLGRYPELRSGDSPGVAERFIIGTFVSVLWAASCAGLAWLVIHHAW